jgi:hypothetical protein
MCRVCIRIRYDQVLVRASEGRKCEVLLKWGRVQRVEDEEQDERKRPGVVNGQRSVKVHSTVQKECQPRLACHERMSVTESDALFHSGRHSGF